MSNEDQIARVERPRDCTPPTILEAMAKILRFNPGVLAARDEALLVNFARYCEPIP